MTTYTVNLSTRAGGLLASATVSADSDLTLTELLRRADLAATPAHGGDVITIEADAD